MLQRIGPLDGEPMISIGRMGLEALACFHSAENAREAVRTLHGTDLRTAREKHAAKFGPPKASECFWLCILCEAGPSYLRAHGTVPPVHLVASVKPVKRQVQAGRHDEPSALTMAAGNLQQARSSSSAGPWRRAGATPGRLEVTTRRAKSFKGKMGGAKGVKGKKVFKGQKGAQRAGARSSHSSCGARTLRAI